MSHCLTQPEEIDHILMTMAGDDMEMNTPIPDGVQSSGAVLDVEREEFAVMDGFPCGATQKKSARGLSDP